MMAYARLQPGAEDPILDPAHIGQRQDDLSRARLDEA